jgi:hypothetical protein
MQNDNHLRRITRGSSPHRELREGIESWVRGLRSVEKSPEDALTARYGVEKEENHKMKFSARATAADGK